MTDTTKALIEAKFADWEDPAGATDKYGFYAYLVELREEGHGWTYAEVTAITGIEEAVIRMRLTDLEKMG